MKKTLSKIKKVAATASIGYLLTPLYAFAAITLDEPTKVSNQPAELNDVVDIIKAVANWMIIFAIIIAVVLLIIAGLTYMTAGGDDEKTGKAKNLIMYTIVGLAIVLIAWGLVTVVISFLGSGLTSIPTP